MVSTVVEHLCRFSGLQESMMMMVVVEEVVETINLLTEIEMKLRNQLVFLLSKRKIMKTKSLTAFVPDGNGGGGCEVSVGGGGTFINGIVC